MLSIINLTGQSVIYKGQSYPAGDRLPLIYNNLRGACRITSTIPEVQSNTLYLVPENVALWCRRPDLRFCVGDNYETENWCSIDCEYNSRNEIMVRREFITQLSQDLYRLATWSKDALNIHRLQQLMADLPTDYCQDAPVIRDLITKVMADDLTTAIRDELVDLSVLVTDLLDEPDEEAEVEMDSEEDKEAPSLQHQFEVKRTMVSRRGGFMTKSDKNSLLRVLDQPQDFIEYCLQAVLYVFQRGKTPVRELIDLLNLSDAEFMKVADTCGWNVSSSMDTIENIYSISPVICNNIIKTELNVPRNFGTLFIVLGKHTQYNLSLAECMYYLAALNRKGLLEWSYAPSNGRSFTRMFWAKRGSHYD